MCVYHACRQPVHSSPSPSQASCRWLISAPPLPLQHPTPRLRLLLRRVTGRVGFVIGGTWSVASLVSGHPPPLRCCIQSVLGSRPGGQRRQRPPNPPSPPLPPPATPSAAPLGPRPLPGRRQPRLGSINSTCHHRPVALEIRQIGKPAGLAPGRPELGSPSTRSSQCLCALGSRRLIAPPPPQSQHRTGPGRVTRVEAASVSRLEGRGGGGDGPGPDQVRDRCPYPRQV